jgi:hypothetical protein
MRKFLQIPAAALLLFSAGCKKNNAANGSPWYLTFQNGAIAYTTTNIDSTVFTQKIIQSPVYTSFTMARGRTGTETDSAAAGLMPLATCYLTIENIGKDTVFTGTYTTDSSSSNTKWFSVGSDFKFYTVADPAKGIFYADHGLPFSLTITAFTSTYVAGTFEGTMVQHNYSTNISDTTTITNGKFKLPLTR